MSKKGRGRFVEYQTIGHIILFNVISDVHIDTRSFEESINQPLIFSPNLNRGIPRYVS